MNPEYPKNRYIRQIRPYELLTYLRNNGWLEETTNRPGVLKFISPHPIRTNGPCINLFIPNSEKLIGHKELIEYAIKSIASFERNNMAEVINKISIFSDCLKTRIINAKKGMLPIDRGIILYTGLHDLITYSAASELDPNDKKPSRGKRAKEYANSSLIGQSEYGSYIANIYIPLERPNKDFDFAVPPFQRKVVLRILRGLENLNEAVEEGSSDPIINNYKTGMNSNMCKAMINIIDAGMGNNIHINAILERAYEPPNDILTEFTLSPQSKRFLKSARDEMSKKEEPYSKEGQWIGFPRLFDRSKEAKRGLIKLEAIDPDEGPINIFIKLNESDYQFCADANLRKRHVQINGVLIKKEKKWILENPNGLDFAGEKQSKVVHSTQTSLENIKM